jgi:hypothetical protein
MVLVGDVHALHARQLAWHVARTSTIMYMLIYLYQAPGMRAAQAVLRSYAEACK